MLRASLIAASALLATAQPAAAKPVDSLWSGRASVAEATVTIPAKSCAGVVVESNTRVLTAAHCVPEGARRLDVVTKRRQRVAGTVSYLDEVRDLALIDLDRAVAVRPLELSTTLPRPGDRILFVGRVDRRSRAQVAKVTHLGQCPSLPGVSDAVFTTVQARPGDSGAPLVDRERRVVGLIHGGAACHIAAPTATLGQKLAAGTLFPQHAQGSQHDAQGSEQDTQDAHDAAPESESAPAEPPPVVLETYRAGPFVFEKLANGFRFHFEFKWSSD